MKQTICYALIIVAEAFIAKWYFDFLFYTKRSRRFISISFILGFLFLFLVFRDGMPLINVPVHTAINLLLWRINYRGRFRSGLLHVVYMCLLITVTELIVSLCITNLTGDFFSYRDSLAVLVAFAVMSKLLYLIVLVVSAHIIKPVRSVSDESITIVYLGAFFLAVMGVVVMILYVSMAPALPDLVENLLTICALTLLFSSVLVLNIYTRVQKDQREKNALQWMRQREIADAEYYDMLQQQYENQRVLIHDINEHAQQLQMLLANGEYEQAEAYVARIRQEPGLSKQVRMCSDPVLNLILVRYAEKCAEKKVTFVCDARDCSLDQLSLLDVTALFGNILSNALEAASESEERYIEFSIVEKEEQSIIVISVVKSCDTEPAQDGQGDFVTRKTDKELHGVGIKSIMRVVKQYRGELQMNFDPERKQFHIAVALPKEP